MNSNLTILPEDDTQALKCAANLLARFTNRVLNPPRAPTYHERDVLSSLQCDLKTQFSPNTVDLTGGEKLLKRLWIAFYGKDVPYARYSKKWSKMGFQHNRDPTSDFRGGGLLSLQCLVYLFEKQPAIAKHMYEMQSVRVSRRGQFATYPYACAGITLVKKLCEILLLCEPMTGKISHAFENSQLTFWQVAGSRNSFYELFVWSFMILDKLWDEMGASYMDFGTVMRIATQRITNVLLRLPNDVVPSARSFMIEDDIEQVMDNQSNQEGVGIFQNSMMIDSDGDSEDEEEEGAKSYVDSVLSSCPDSDNDYSTLPSANSSKSFGNFNHDINQSNITSSITSSQCLTEDLLGLDTYAYGATLNKQPTSIITTTTTTAQSTQSFFEEFGLEL